ncbi:hypothetical protein Tco_0971038 [Tanacetum coccineum]
MGRGGLPMKMSCDKQQSSCRQGECDEIYKPKTSIVKDSDDDSETAMGSIIFLMVLVGGFVRYDGWIANEKHQYGSAGVNHNNGNVDVDFLENNMNLLERSKNNLNFPGTHDGQTTPMSAQQLRKLCQVTSPTFVPNYHNKERSTSMQKAG